MELHRIAVISDTHGLLRPEVLEKLKASEAILHAGDFDKPDILEKLQEICPVWAVRGNVDKEWADGCLPEELETVLFGFRFYITHNRKHVRKDLSGIDVVVYGHSHKYEERRENDILYLNPGSCGPKRFRLPVTMAVLTLYPEEHRIEAERIDCVPAAAPSGRSEGGSAAVPGQRRSRAGSVSEEGRSDSAATPGQRRSRSGPVSEEGRSDSAAAPGQRRSRFGPVSEEGRSDSAAAHGQCEEKQWPEQDVDMHKLVKAIMKDVRAGRTVAGIAARHHVKEELAEEICRYYVTHPGVDVDGILDRMERKNL